MKKSEWSDRKLEELLRQMPKILDHRHPHDIYQNISLRKRKTFPWIFPGIAAIVALFLLVILIPEIMWGTPLFQNHVNHEKSTADHAQKKENHFNPQNTESRKDSVKILMSSKVNSSEQPKTAIYANDVGNGLVLTYWIPDQQGQILVPVSTIIKKTQGKSWLILFNEKMAELKEDEWGLSNYYPLSATLRLDVNHKNSVCVDVPDTKYTQGAGNETNFIHVLERDISSNSTLKKIKLSTNGTPGINFGNYGKLEELNIKIEKGHGIFFYYPKNSKMPFLVPSTDSFKDIKTAIVAMRNDLPVTGLKKSLTSLKIRDVSIFHKTLYIYLDGNSKIKNDRLTLSSFEAILLTAKEFGLEKVIVKGVQVTHLGPFDLSKEMRVPVAPNYRIF